MKSPRPLSFLEQVLLADAVVSAATGVLLWLAAAPLAPLLGLPEALLRYAGASLLPFAAIVAWLAARGARPRGAVWGVVVYNVVWALDSLLLLFTGWFDPTAIGAAFVAAQALVVAALAELQVLGLRRTRALLA